MKVNIDDFRYMWRGKQLHLLTHQQAHLLSPIDIRGEGHERALLLLHGFSSSPAVYRHLIPQLTSHYDSIFCPTLPGHGENIVTFSAVKATEWLTMVEQTCQEMIKKYKHVDVLGLSLGGLLACHLSERFSLNHLYLLAPATALQLNIPFGLTLAILLRFLGFKYLRNRAGNLQSKRHSELAYRKVPINTILEILTLIKGYQFVPPTCPTDVFLGRFDKVVNTTVVEKDFSNLPNTHIHWLEKSAHVLPLDADLDQIVECIKKNQ